MDKEYSFAPRTSQDRRDPQSALGVRVNVVPVRLRHLQLAGHRQPNSFNKGG